MTRTAAPLLLLALLAGCTSPDTAPTMMYRQSALRPRPAQPVARQPYRPTPEPPRMASAPPGVAVRPGTPYAPTYPPPSNSGYAAMAPVDRSGLRTVGYEEVVEEDYPARPTVSARHRPPEDFDLEVEAADLARPRKKTAMAATALDRMTQGAAGEEEAKARGRTVRLVNSQRIQLSYEVRDGEEAGVSQVDVWYAHEGGRWQRCGSAPRSQTPYVVEVPGEGVYGFLMLARAAGAPDTPPRANEQPQMTVEVDVSKPEVSILAAKAETEGSSRSVDIRWWASDKNLRDGTVCVSYSRQPTGPWHPVVSGMKGDGQYLWKVPAAAPHTVYLLVEAEDWAGNVGGAVTPKPILFETPRPPVTIKGIQPATPAPTPTPSLGLQFEN